MRKLLWLGRLGLVTLAFVLLPTDVHDGSLSGATLCAAEEGADVSCRLEANSYCSYGGVTYADRSRKKE